jgi:hypothetical protein
MSPREAGKEGASLPTTAYHDDHAGVHAGASAGTKLPPDEIDVELHLKAGRPPFDVN